MTFDLISIGVTFVDTFIPLIDAKILKDGEVNYLGVPFGSKVPVGPSTSAIGGNAANNAVASSRLGLKTAIYTHVGNKDEDQWDNRVLAKFKKEKIDTRYVKEIQELPTGHNIILEFKGERTILSHHQPWEYGLPDLEKTKWVYLTSLAPSFEKSNLINQLLNFTERSGARLAYQPGTFQISLGYKKNSKVLVLSDIFILNLEEAKIFLGLDITEKIPVKKLLSKLYDLGPKKVIITDSIRGSFGFDGSNFYQMGIFPVDAIQVTGCGDAYASAVAAGLFYGKDLSEAMRWGAVNSAAVARSVGAQAGLLTYEKMQSILKENSKIKALEI
ncbi:carbohydrate kinase family protein [Candidatus Daviesbacteria bacterium]|nr:carbohydrate kinase family protein [Candidatus Daviesbacteria bacterium]